MIRARRYRLINTTCTALPITLVPSVVAIVRVVQALEGHEILTLHSLLIIDTAFVKSQSGWLYCDDSRITNADSREVVGKPAYVLYYKRVKW